MKKELRAAMKRRNLALSPAERVAASAKIFARVERLSRFGMAHTVALYCALPDEPDTREALARWGQQKRLVVPRVEGNVMRFFDYNPAVMCKGAFGIAEPGPGAQLCEPSDIDLVVVPGAAFTVLGDRMGRGGGYYDKYLASLRAFKVGVCYAHQLVEELPVEAHDVAMDGVIADDAECIA